MTTTRTLATGKAVAVHDNRGLRKRCGCPRRRWAACPHPWHFNFAWKGRSFRVSLDEACRRPVRTKAEALAEADRLRAAIRDGAWPPAPASRPVPTPGDVTVAEFIDRWQAAVPRSPQETANTAGRVRRLLAVSVAGAALGSWSLGALTEDVVEQALTTLAASGGRRGRPLAASSWNKYRGLVLVLQRWGLRKGYLTRPWLGDAAVRGPEATVKRRKGAQRARRLVPDVKDAAGAITQPGEERRLLAAASPWLQRLIIAALETGARRGELLALQWRDVGLPRGELTFRAETTKTRQARTIPISPALRAVLDLLRLDPTGRELPPTAYVFGDRAGGRVGSPKKAWEACVLRAHGHPPQYRGTALDAASRARYAEIDLHFHDLRHEAGSRLVERGWPVHHVQAMLGHADLKTTSTYLNLTRTGLADSMRRYGTGPDTPLHNLAHAPGSDPRPSVQAPMAPAPQVTVN
jgi:integrase